MLQRLVIHPSQLCDRQVALTDTQRHYLCRVLRLGAGDRFVVLDGQGQSWQAQLAANGAELIETLVGQTELPLAVTLVAALPKGNGFDEVVRQCTELGVVGIIPVMSDRTLLHPSPQKLERWRRIAQEAAEQSERQVVPTILEPLPFKTLLREPNPQGTLIQSTLIKYLCAERGSSPHLLHSLDLLDSLALPAPGREPAPSITIAVGPEGGWTDAEITAAIAADYQTVSLGPRILRAVTAPMVALAIIAARYECQAECQTPTV
jgi:16S rRNA (uracil1498-N3)-methyltransferase